MNPTSEAYGFVSTLIMGWGPLRFWLSRSLPAHVQTGKSSLTSGEATLSLCFSTAQLLPLALSLECLAENKGSVLLLLTNTRCSAQRPHCLLCHNHLILCHPLLLLPSVFPSIRVFSNESALHIRWPKYWRFSFSLVLQMNIQGWFPFGLTGSISKVQGALKSLLQHCNSKTSFFRHLTYFRVQLSHPYMTTGKTIALTIQTFVGKVMSLVFNMLSRYGIAFLLRNKCLLISWLKSLSAVILEPRKIKSVTVSTFFPSIYHEVMGMNAMIFLVWMSSFKPAFSFSSFTFIKRLFSSSSFLLLKWYHFHIWGCW